MSDGWNWRQPEGGTRPPGSGAVGGSPAPAAPTPSAPAPAVPVPSAAAPAAGPVPSAWWSDALDDPWRDPQTSASIVLPPGPAGTAAPAPEPVTDPNAVRGPRLAPVLLVALVTALLAGALGGALGYAAAVRGGAGAGTTLGGSAGELPAAARRPPDSFAGVAERLLPSVVTVRVGGGVRGLSVGSGFVASADGYVITNHHVVEAYNGAATVAFSDGSTASATVVGQDPESDIAVIKVTRDGLTPVEFGDSDALAVGDPVLAFGSPLALANTVTSGIVSAVDRTIQAGGPNGQVRYYAAIQTDAAVNQGNSGGPLVDGAGRVVGVNSVIKSLATDQEEAGNIGLAFAIPINQAKRISQDIINTGRARRTVIGAQVSDGGAAIGAGVRLAAVDPAGPAAEAGLRTGDVIVKLGGRPLAEATDLIALVRKYAPGSVVAVEYRRGSQVQTASVTLAADVK